MKDPDAWVAAVAAKFGWSDDAIRKAFADELAGAMEPGAPLQVPDRIYTDYRFSYGGVSRHFRALRDEGRFLASRCPACGKVWLPPRTTCQACYQATEWKEVGPGGVIVTRTTVHVTSSAFVGKAPLACAFIRLDGASTAIMGNILDADPAAMRPGARVTAVFKPQAERLGTMADFSFRPE